MERCLAKDPEKRYDSTGDLARELELVPAVATLERRDGERTRVQGMTGDREFHCRPEYREHPKAPSIFLRVL